MPNQSHRTLALVLALALLAACKTTPVLAPTGDGTVSSERGGAKLSVAGHVFAMRTLDGKSLDTLDLQIGDLIFHTKDGKLTLPEGALAAIRARGAFLVRAPGYVPRKVAFDGQGDVALVPVGPTLASGSIPPAGGHLGGGSVSLDLPLGMLAQPATVTVHPYQVPAGDLNAPGAAQERAAVLAATGHPDQGCDHPLPCPPPTSAIGLLIDVDGHLNDGTLAVSYDLAALAREGNQAAVDRLRATFAAIDATNDPVWRQVLQQRYGITLVGDRLGFPVRVGDAAFNDGVARIEVDGLGMLGVRLEVTLLSQAQGPAPTAGGGTPPSTRPLGDRQVLGNMGNLITNDGASLITNDGGSLIGQDGASLITNDGGSFINHVNGIVAQGGGNILTDNGNLLLAGAGNGLITNDGGSLISNDGGGLIALNAGGSLTGLVADPGQAAGTGPGGNGKFALLSVPATPALGSAVKAIDGLGAQFGPTAFTDATGRYKIQRLPITWNGLIVQAQVGTDVLRTLAPAPGKRTIQANLSAATSGIAAVVLDGQAASPGQTLGISRGAYQADTDTLDGLMTLADARFMVSNGTPAVASYVRGLFTAAGKTMALSLPAGPPATPTPAPTATPTPAPSASPNGFGTSLTCDPGTELQIHGLGLPAGMVGLRVTIGGLAAPISRVVGANDFFIIIPANIPIASTTLSIFYAPGGTGPESNIWNWAIDVNPPAATTFSLQVAGGNPARGTTLAMAGAGLPPQAQLQVTIGGVVQPISLATGSILQVTVDSTTPLGPQPLVITWYDPASGARVVLFDTITIL